MNDDNRKDAAVKGGASAGVIVCVLACVALLVYFKWKEFQRIGWWAFVPAFTWNLTPP